MKILLGCSENSVEHRVGQKGTYLVLDWRGPISAVAKREFFKFFFKKSPHRLVFERSCNPFPVFLIREHSEDIVQGRIRLLKERHQRIAQDVLHAYAQASGHFFLKTSIKPE